jgi:hypothetical protein
VTAPILHHPRLAWDLARVLVRAADAGGDACQWLAAQLAEVLGEEFRWKLCDTADRVWLEERADVRQVESGLWRWRLTDVLDREPDLAPGLELLRQHALQRLARTPTAN